MTRGMERFGLLDTMFFLLLIALIAFVSAMPTVLALAKSYDEVSAAQVESQGGGDALVQVEGALDELRHAPAETRYDPDELNGTAELRPDGAELRFVLSHPPRASSSLREVVELHRPGTNPLHLLELRPAEVDLSQTMWPGSLLSRTVLSARHQRIELSAPRWFPLSRRYPSSSGC